MRITAFAHVRPPPNATNTAPLLFCAVTAVSAAAALGACWRLAETAGIPDVLAGLLGPISAEAAESDAQPTAPPAP